jgi:hypothetical protein
MSKYDFSEIEPEKNDSEQEEDPRTNFRITKSCSNCRYFFYTGVKSRRGYCKLTNIKHMNIGAFHRTDTDAIAEEHGWPPTHCTNLCDRHEIRGQKSFVRYPEKHTGKKFNIDGSLRDDIIDIDD